MGRRQPRGDDAAVDDRAHRTMGVEVKDVYSVAGDVLTIDRSMGRVTQKLIYKKGAPR